MSENFNAAIAPWLTVRDLNDHIEDVNLSDALVRAHEIAELADASPLGVASQLRLLLALVYRVFGGDIRNDKGWRALYEENVFPAEKLRRYFEERRSSFDLFGERPFLQVASLTTDKESPLARLVPERTSGNNPTLFDHSADGRNVAYTPAEALRMLLIAQAFGLGGLLRAKGTVFGAAFAHPNTTDGPVARGGTLWLTGATLFHTLMLNLPPPQTPTPDDKPCWEQTLDATYFGRTRSDGPMDRFTCLSRMVRLIPETDPDTGQTVVRRMYFTQGRSLDKAELDPMQTYRKSEQQGFRPVLIGESKATWRDLSALLQVNQVEGIRADALAFVGGLIENGHLPSDAAFRLHVAGMASDKAKVNLWRYDRVSLPAAFLANDALVGRLAKRLEEAEELAQLVWSRVRLLCRDFLSPVNGMMAPDPRNVAALAGQIDPRRTYWARMEMHLPALLEGLAGDQSEAAEEEWRNAAGRAASEATQSAINQLGTNARAWRAAASITTFYKL